MRPQAHALIKRKQKLEVSQEKIDRAVSEGKMEELKNDWKRESEHEKIHLNKIVEQQIQDRTKEMVIKVNEEQE